MRNFRKDQQGFSAFEVILVLVILALIGTVGWLVYDKHNHETTASVSTTPASTATKSTAKTTTAADPYAGWQSYTLKYEKLAFKYPSTWTIKDDSASQGLTTNADNVTLTAGDGFAVSIDDGWDGGGDSLDLATDSPLPLTFLGSPADLVFSHVRCYGPGTCDANALKGGTLMLKPSSDYSQNNTAGYFPQDKNAHGDPSVNNGGSTLLISAGYSGTSGKTFANVAQAQSDPEIKNAVLFFRSMHY